MERDTHLEDIRPDFVKMANESYQKLWETLTNQQKSIIESQATLRTLDTEAKVNRFFESRIYDLHLKPIVGAANINFSKNDNTLLESIDNDPVCKAMKRLNS